MSRARTRIRWDDLFAQRTKTSAADGLTAILHLANKTDLISFAGGFPDPSTFPGPALAEHFDRLVSDRDVSALQYAPVAGLPGPRSFIADRLELDGDRPDDDELMITSGAIEALELLGKSLIDSGDLVFVEGPTYLGAIMAFQSFEANVREVLMDEQGLDVERLEAAIVEHGRPKFLYTIPDHQNPAGITLAHDRRERLVEVARHHGFLIIEDVAYRELGFGHDRLPSLWSLAPDVVVQAGTFSKTFIPGVRLGWGAGPPEIVASMIWAKQNTDQCATALGQRLLEEYGRAGGLEEQARRSRALYGRRCALLMDRARSAHARRRVVDHPARWILLVARLAGRSRRNGCRAPCCRRGRCHRAGCAVLSRNGRGRQRASIVQQGRRRSHRRGHQAVGLGDSSRAERIDA